MIDYPGAVSETTTSAGRALDAERVAESDRAIATLAARRAAWVRVAPADRARLLRRCITGVLETAPQWVRDACVQRSIDPASPLAGEEWISGPMTVVRHLRLYAEALEAGGRPKPPAVRRRADGQYVVDVFPASPLDRFLYYNMRAEVRIEPDRSPTVGRIYREKAEGRFGPGALALVLGAGNVSSIAPLDAAHKLLVDDAVVLLKLNPVNDYLRPHLERALAPLIEDGFLRLICGGAELGDYLCRHPGVESIHLTGSAATFEAIVWGNDEDERKRRRAANDPRVDKPFSAELGCITPIIVVPGDWSASALDYQARHVAAMVAHNASFNCNAGKVLVLPRGWPSREAFLDRVRTALRRTPPRVAYYPGSQERYAEICRRYPRAEALGARGEGVVPWTLVPDVPIEAGQYLLEHEPWCGVLAECSIEAQDAGTFLRRAVRFVNERVEGTLSCVLLVDSPTRRSHTEEFGRALDDLRYGGIAINAWSGTLFGLGVTAWGAHIGNTREAIGSGVGFVHNTYLLDHPAKSVIEAPFRIRPKPVWFADHRTLDRVGRHLATFEGQRSPMALAGLAFAGLFG